MASRRDELNAYTFAKKRLVAAFLQPSAAGTDEAAPRPLRAVLPGLVVGALLLAGFGAWGIFKPKVPNGWSAPGAHVIVGSESTTRYVVLETKGVKRLHPVLNFASAKLLLDPDNSSVMQVPESVLDGGGIQRGPMLGIPYAPDRLPSAAEAGRGKLWVVCEQPGAGAGRTVQKAVFLLADREAGKVGGKRRLHEGQALYVEADGDEATRYLVEPDGTRHAVGTTGGDRPPAREEVLRRSLFGDGARPQRVTDDWLRTLHTGSAIDFPKLPGKAGAPAGVGGGLDARLDKVGMVLKAVAGTGMQHYVVLPGEVAPVSDFVARLLLTSPEAAVLGQKAQAAEVAPQSFTPSPDEFYADKGWPASIPVQANDTAARTGTVCNVLHGVDAKGVAELTTWAGPRYPVSFLDGATSAYVTPGSGVLYRQFSGASPTTGSLFLVTDTGLRYAVQTNNDSSADPSEIGETAKPGAPGERTVEVNQTQIRLGYRNVRPVPVPENWSNLLPKGPRLDTNSAKQPQSS
ncbi:MULTISPECIES: type VII secretion protein EccB [unclassified Streptomyces]|uniref:type VII secretion protein EccB n=1 Tax=unclassified Streptomyces TaxID=2593676 RepID=UPI000DACB455|nr:MULTISPECIES: type VII secretion protein EccB [unclassified Streptomyces]PZT72391.1 type VII secretion protein EccB [Streptomyces sp. AC1-42T]PZT81290.1 type VII secretion protein EccB [Streptomyces sp. AC1-42W]WUC94213.1 type VII secretion protein EccB [Streptomyces sp. NBC_00525]